MKTRFTVNDRGELVSRDGEILGRVTSITLDRDLAKSEEERGTIGGSVVEEPQQQNTKETPLTPRDKVWAHYVSLFGNAYVLNETRKRIIDNAVKVRSEERCILAVSGLHKSSWHNGDNEQKKKYLDIRYALKGNSARGESNDERIDKMAALAEEQVASSSSLRIPDAVTDMERMRLRSMLSELDVTDDEERRAYVLQFTPTGFVAVPGEDGRWRIERT